MIFPVHYLLIYTTMLVEKLCFNIMHGIPVQSTITAGTVMKSM